ncbi:MAG TPA: hypothetical protein VIN35_07070 [Hydrogenophaga sp.]
MNFFLMNESENSANKYADWPRKQNLTSLIAPVSGESGATNPKASRAGDMDFAHNAPTWKAQLLQ